MFYKNNDILASVFTLPNRKSAVGQGLYHSNTWHLHFTRPYKQPNKLGEAFYFIHQSFAFLAVKQIT